MSSYLNQQKWILNILDLRYRPYAGFTLLRTRHLHFQVGNIKIFIFNLVVFNRVFNCLRYYLNIFSNTGRNRFISGVIRYYNVIILNIFIQPVKRLQFESQFKKFVVLKLPRTKTTITHTTQKSSNNFYTGHVGSSIIIILL